MLFARNHAHQLRHVFRKHFIDTIEQFFVQGFELREILNEEIVSDEKGERGSNHVAQQVLHTIEFGKITEGNIVFALDFLVS